MPDPKPIRFSPEEAPRRLVFRGDPLPFEVAVSSAVPQGEIWFVDPVTKEIRGKITDLESDMDTPPPRSSV